MAWAVGFCTQTGADTTHGDANGDGDVDGHDFLQCQHNFGTGLAGGSTTFSAVPEPSALGILILSDMLVMRLQIRRH